GLKTAILFESRNPAGVPQIADDTSRCARRQPWATSCLPESVGVTAAVRSSPPRTQRASKTRVNAFEITGYTSRTSSATTICPQTEPRIPSHLSSIVHDAGSHAFAGASRKKRMGGVHRRLRLRFQRPLAYAAYATERESSRGGCSAGDHG